jgi:hypothetical protein
MERARLLLQGASRAARHRDSALPSFVNVKWRLRAFSFRLRA